MTDDTMKQNLEGLSVLLDAERAALLTGDLEGVGALLADKEVLIDQINQAALHDPEALRAVRDKVHHNQKLFDGALDGIRTVSERMAALHRVQTSIETYGADGSRRDIHLAKRGTVERRA